MLTLIFLPFILIHCSYGSFFVVMDGGLYDLNISYSVSCSGVLQSKLVCVLCWRVSRFPFIFASGETMFVFITRSTYYYRRVRHVTFVLICFPLFNLAY